MEECFHIIAAIKQFYFLSKFVEFLGICVCFSPTHLGKFCLNSERKDTIYKVTLTIFAKKKKASHKFANKK